MITHTVKAVSHCNTCVSKRDLPKHDQSSVSLQDVSNRDLAEPSQPKFPASIKHHPGTRKKKNNAVQVSQETYRFMGCQATVPHDTACSSDCVNLPMKRGSNLS